MAEQRNLAPAFTLWAISRWLRWWYHTPIIHSFAFVDSFEFMSIERSAEFVKEFTGNQSFCTDELGNIVYQSLNQLGYQLCSSLVFMPFKIVAISQAPSCLATTLPLLNTRMTGTFLILWA